MMVCPELEVVAATAPVRETGEVGKVAAGSVDKAREVEGVNMAVAMREEVAIEAATLGMVTQVAGAARQAMVVEQAAAVKESRCRISCFHWFTSRQER